MNTSELIELLKSPQKITEKETISLEMVLHQYPFFQSVRALHLRGLHNQNSFRYNYELKKTAAHTIDRNILFEYITSNNFELLRENLSKDEPFSIENKIVEHDYQSDLQYTETFFEKVKNDEADIESNSEIQNTHINTENSSLQEKEEKLNIGKPIPFQKEEKHSFQEWLQLTQAKPIIREEEEDGNLSNFATLETEVDEERLKKLDLIDRFIELNPKISPAKTNTTPPPNIKKSLEEPTHFMTETLAKVYLEQKKYQKAIQAYEILILKYPEKSSLFADRINDIKDLQNNNNN